MERSDEADAGASLTGVWQGRYTYAAFGKPVSFTATLIQSGASLSGATHETCAFLFLRPKTHCAILDGARDGRAVHFIKTYDGSGGWSHSVAYEGVVNGDGTEIEGSWRVAGGFTGRFLMIRPGGVSRSRKAKRLVEA